MSRAAAAMRRPIDYLHCWPGGHRFAGAALGGGAACRGGATRSGEPGWAMGTAIRGDGAGRVMGAGRSICGGGCRTKGGAAGRAGRAAGAACGACRIGATRRTSGVGNAAGRPLMSRDIAAAGAKRGGGRVEDLGGAASAGLAPAGPTGACCAWAAGAIGRPFDGAGDGAPVGDVTRAVLDADKPSGRAVG